MSAPGGLQQYQQSFTAHLRDPSSHSRPHRLAARRMRIYNELVFNNLQSSIAACFPVCRQVLGKRAWLKLVRSFFANYQSATPIFREIPQQFLNFLQQDMTDVSQLPEYLLAVAHYEWIELALAVAPDTSPEPGLQTDGDLLAQCPVWAPVLALLHYDYPVQLISPRFKPQQQQAVDLLVFRDASDDVKFIELNPITARLVALLQQQQGSGQQAFQQLADEVAVHGQAVSLEVLLGFGLDLLQSLRQQGAILGSRPVR